MTTHTAQVALEVWLASGERTKNRLLDLVAHYAETNGQACFIAHHEESALTAVKPWQWGHCPDCGDSLINGECPNPHFCDGGRA